MKNEIRKPSVWKTLQLPNGDTIMLAGRYDDGSALSLDDANHNVYRLTADGEVVWQVRRVDSNRPADWWEQMHKLARASGYDGMRMPFAYIDLVYPDGRRIHSDEHGDGKEIAVWEPGCRIEIYGYDGPQTYELDPETGIANNVTPKNPGRPW